MELFSVRHGYKPEKSLQIESMDDGLRNRLWNVLKRHLEDMYRNEATIGCFFDLLHSIWDCYFKRSMDDFPTYTFDEVILNENFEEESFYRPTEAVKATFYDYSWHEVYDLLEFIARNHPDTEAMAPKDLDRVVRLSTLTCFVEATNRVLEEEQAGYRLIDSIITPIITEVEIKEIEDALNSPGPASENTEKALKHLSDREQPDYENSIKESLSAVESIANLITGEKHSSLGKALPQIEKKLGHELHSAKRQALLKLYGWASDEARHGLLEESNLTQEDARFALVVCSAFVNYLKTKAANAGISLESNT